MNTENVRTELNTRLAALKDERDTMLAQLHDAPRGDGMGDHSEAQIAIARIDAQIRTVTERLANLNTDIPAITYHCEDENGEPKTYVLVHPEMSDPTKGHVSPTSPIGRALQQAVAGDEISIRTPRGLVDITVLTISAIPVERKTA